MTWGKKKRLRVAAKYVRRATRELEQDVKRLQDVVDGKPCSHPVLTSQPQKSDRPGWFHFDTAFSTCAYCGADTSTPSRSDTTDFSRLVAPSRNHESREEAQ